MPLKILYHHRTQGRGAEGLHISRIVLALRELGHDVVVVSPPGIDPMAAHGGLPIEQAGARIPGLARFWKWMSRNLPGFVFELAEVAYNVPAYFRMRRLLATQKFDLIYERYAFYLLAGAWLSRQFDVPLVLEANEVSGVESRVRKQLFPHTCERFERRLFKQCLAIHTVSSYLERRIVDSGISAAKVFVAPNAFDVRSLEGRLSNEAIRTRFGLQGKRVIGFAGWFSDWDRLDFLIDVFHDLKPSHPDLALLLIGDGPIVPKLRAQAQRLGLEHSVVFTGPVPRSQIYGHLALLDVAVLPHSNRFGSPVVMFEFMGLKIPVVAPRLEPIMDVQGDGETALLFDPLDLAQCADAVERLLLDPQRGEQLAHQAYDQLVAEHTWKRNAERILSSAGLH